MVKSFPGGIHPPYRKEATSALAIERMNPPKTVAIPLQQHIGSRCDPLVAVGDRVLMGQKIGDSSAPISAPVHSSVSGKVTAIEQRPHPNGRTVLSVVIANDFQDEMVALMPAPKLEQLTAEQLTALIREAGIVGMGGGGFPTHAKLKPPQGVVLDAVLLNGAECEPYLTTDHRVMLEWSADVVYGLRCLMKAARVEKGYIGIEVNKPDAIEALKAEAKDYSSIEIVSLAVKYPQGAEIQLIDACLGRKVPSGKLPLHVGVVVNNVHTAQAVAKSLRTGVPSIERVITVAGNCMERPGNLLVRVGTTFADILADRGLKCEPYKLISGGPMMGIAMYSADVAVCKCTSGILALSKDEATYRIPGNCVRCAKCVDVCPMLLHPTFIAQYAERGMMERAEEYGAVDCRECGACTYVCPVNLPLTQHIRLAKSDIYAKRK
ncbi:MAG: electron transport complex protein RnfC [Bacillota bacterium]|nr:MAG: electron transport complex protein RnfC [Bacillota bacterium]